MNTKQRILIIGASSLIAEHCARLWSSKNPTELILVGRNPLKLQGIAQDLRVRNPNTEVEVHEINFLDTKHIEQLITQIFQKNQIDIALIAHGHLPDQTACQENISLCKDAIEINALSPVLFAEEIIKNMLKINYGRLGIIGSVAGDRGRKSNYIYGASKGFIDLYMQGLQHRLALTNSSVHVTLVKPGPTATPMTTSIETKGKLAKPATVAQNIVTAIEKKQRYIYTPRKWAIIMLIIKNLPFFLFKKIDI